MTPEHEWWVIRRATDISVTGATDETFIGVCSCGWTGTPLRRAFLPYGSSLREVKPTAEERAGMQALEHVRWQTPPLVPHPGGIQSLVPADRREVRDR
jgi:hypothetical protein